MIQRQQVQKTRKQPEPVLSVGDAFDEKYYERHDLGELNLDSTKLKEARVLVFSTHMVGRKKFKKALFGLVGSIGRLFMAQIPWSFSPP